MQNTDNNYNLIISGEHITEYKLKIAGQNYFNSDIVSGNITGSLFDNFGIGNTISRSIKVSIVPKGEIPVRSKIEVFCRIYNDSLTSDWIPKGQFFIDTRDLDDSGVLTLSGFDAMLKSEVTFFKSGTWVSRTALFVVSQIANDMDVDVDEATLQLITLNPHMISHVPEMGENGTTSRQMLGYIGTMYGGNWIINDFGKLKLYVLTDIPLEADILLGNEQNYNIQFGEDLIIVE